MCWRPNAQGEATLIGGAALQEGSVDGLGSAARFVEPTAIAVDADDNLYVADGGYRSPTIRKGQLAGPPTITAQPQSATAVIGNSVRFSVTATGVPSPTYQWCRNGAPINGATDSSIDFPGVQSTDAGQYTVVVTNALGSVTSSAALLTINAASAPTGSSEGGGGSDGGGLIEAWFVVLLAAVTAARRQSINAARKAAGQVHSSG